MLNFLKKVLIVLLVPIFLAIFMILCVVVILPLLMYRWSISVLAKLCKSRELHKMVTCVSSVMGAEDIYSINAFTISTSMELAIPCPDIEKMRQCFETSIQAVDNDGSLMFPELRETIKSWMGFLFWSPVKNFDIKNHVYFFQELNLAIPDWSDLWSDPLALHKLGLYLIRDKKWVKGQPLWEFIIIPNVPKRFFEKFPDTSDYNEGSMIMFRMHHVMGDGFCIFKFLARTFGFLDNLEKSILKVKDMREKQNRFELLLEKIKFAFMIPYEMVEYLITSCFVQISVPKLGDEKGKGSQLNGVDSQDIPLARIKNVKNLHHVDFTSVILAILTAATRRMILKYGGNLEISSDMEVNIPLPMPGHSDKLRNHVTFGSLMLPISEPDSAKRLKKIRKRILQMKNSTLLWSFFLLTRCVGSFPMFLARFLRQFAGENGAPLLFSNILGPYDPIYFDEIPVVGIRIASNAPIGVNSGYCFLLVTYNGNARIACGALSNYLRSLKDAQELLEYCIEELDVLSREQIV